MIIGPDFIWLHVPKCGGTSVERCLRKVFAHRPDVYFDEIDPQKGVIWHQGVTARQKHDPNFDPSGKRIAACIRRLPGWLLSRVHFEAARGPNYLVPTREMLVQGQFFENSGYLNSADKMIRNFIRPEVDHWLRIEHLREDLTAFFGFDTGEVPRINETSIKYIKQPEFWFTAEEILKLYENNPVWAAIERKVYGNTMAETM